MDSQIYLAKLQLNKANTSDTKASFLDLHLSILNLKSMTYAVILISTLLILHISTVMFPAPLLMVFTSINLFALLGCLVI